MPHVISASRRTDIPAFYSEWFVARLQAGFVFVQNPYSGKFSRVSLQSRDVAALFFCSKNYSPLLPKLEAIEKTSHDLFFHFTITANRDLELNTPDYRDAIRDYIFLARRYSARQIVWRYDPVCITDRISFELNEERFVRCAELLKGHADKCIISFMHPYKKAVVNIRKYSDHRLNSFSEQEKREFALLLSRRASNYGIQLYSCCNEDIVSDTVLKGGCIDGQNLSGIFNKPVDSRKAPTRKGCGCTKSIDIGAYDTCPHGCLYCYANADKEHARRALLNHDPAWNSLKGNILDAGEEAADKNVQTELFPFP